MSTTPVSPAPDQTQLDPNQAPTSGNVVGGVPGIAQPSVQAASPTTNAQAVSQVAQQPVSQPTLAQQHTGWFHSMLARMNQGDQVPLRDRAGNPVVDPQTGQVKTQPLTSKQMGRSILAGVLSAMAATEQHQPYRNGNGIWQNPSNEAVAAGDQAFQAGRPRNQIREAQAQATSQRTQQYAAYENNLKMLAQTQTLYQLKGQQMTEAVNHYKDLSDQFAAGGIVNPETGDSLYDPNYANMTPQEAEDHLKKGDITRDTMFPVSVEPIIGQDGQPTGQSQLRWAAIKGPANVHVNQDMIDKYPELKGVQVGVSMPILQYLKLARTSADNSSLGSMIQNVQDAQVAANMPGAKPVNFNWDQFRRDARLTTDQAHQLHGLAGLPPDEFIAKIRQMDSANGGGGRIAEALFKQGITVNDKDWAQKRAGDLVKAKAEGDKLPAPKAQTDAVVAAAKKLPAEYQPTILSGINPNGMTVGELEKLKDKVLDVQKHVDNLDQKKLTQGGDPVLQSKTANNIIEGDVARLDKVTSVRGNARQELMDAIHDEAQRRGLDTTQFSPAALENKSNTWNDYNGNKKSSTGSQIASFNAFLGHTAGAVDAEKRLEGKTIGLTRSPWVNTAMDSLGKQVTDDPDWKAYKTSLLPVQNEISNFLAAGYAVKAEDAALMQQAVDPHETPARITAALRQLAETADIRLQAIGQRYLDTMGTTYPNLMSADSMNTLKRLGIESKALPLSQRLPRGWQNNQPQKVTDKNVAQAFYLAAGKDKAKAQELAKQNGWQF